MIIPPLFRCPISLDLFQDPVTLCTGQTYDRPCIQKWLSAGNSSCPITMQKLDDTTMVPNHTLAHLINQWLHSHTINTNTNTGTTCTIKDLLESQESTLQDKIQALDDAIQAPHATSLFKIVLELSLRNGQSLVLVEKALVCALKLMPFAGTGALSILLKQELNYTRFLLLLEKGSRGVKKSQCLIIVEAISLCSETKHLFEEKLVRRIVEIIMPGNDEEVVDAGIRAALALSYTDPTRGYLVSQGAVGVLISYLCSDCISGREMAMCTIENLLPVRGAKHAVLNHELGVKGIVKMVFRVSEHLGSESAVNSLIIICSDSLSGRETAIQQGVLTQLLLLLQSQCNARTKTRATALLKLLRST